MDVRPQLDVGAVGERQVRAGDVAQDGSGVEHLDVVAAAQHVLDDELGLDQVR